MRFDAIRPHDDQIEPRNQASHGRRYYLARDAGKAIFCSGVLTREPFSSHTTSHPQAKFGFRLGFGVAAGRVCLFRRGFR